MNTDFLVVRTAVTGEKGYFDALVDKCTGNIGASNADAIATCNANATTDNVSAAATKLDSRVFDEFRKLNETNRMIICNALFHSRDEAVELLNKLIGEGKPFVGNIGEFQKLILKTYAKT
jgi:hypothetical protein